jgi:small multidrug resistance pump
MSRVNSFSTPGSVPSAAAAPSGQFVFRSPTSLGNGVRGVVAAFVLLTLTLKQGMGIGVAYGIWAAFGVALTAVASKAFFSEPLTGVMIAGIALIIAGVLLVELGASH